MEILDRNQLVDNVDGDVELLAELVDLFFETANGTVKTIHDAVQAEDAVALRESAHRLKGALANMGATAARHAADVLETCGREGTTQVGAALATLDRELGRLEPELRELVRAHGG